MCMVLRGVDCLHLRFGTAFACIECGTYYYHAFAFLAQALSSPGSPVTAWKQNVGTGHIYELCIDTLVHSIHIEA